MQGNVRLYEIGSAFERGTDALPDETVRVAALVMGSREPAHFTNAKPAPYDAWDAKTIAETIARVAVGTAQLVPAETGGDELWSIVVDGERRGHVSRVPLDAPVWASQAYGIEMILGSMSNGDVAPPGEHAHDLVAPHVPRRVATYRPLPSTPAAEFDLALLVPDGVRAADVDRVIRAAAGELLENLVAFDLYEGAGVDAGHRSVAWRLTLRHPERTLRDKEIEGRRAKILSALQTELNVRQRST
jgi:phenylalanyl-tRNA synthetase beta chain